VSVAVSTSFLFLSATFVSELMCKNSYFRFNAMYLNGDMIMINPLVAVECGGVGIKR